MKKLTGGASSLVALFAVLLSGAGTPDERSALAAQSMAVLPLAAKAQIDAKQVAVLDDLLLSALQASARGARVLGQSDIDRMLGFERVKDAVGCSDVSCAVEIAGALGVDSLIYGSVGRLGKKYVLSLSWIDQHAGRVLGRDSEVVDTEEELIGGIQRAVAAALGVPPALSARPAGAEATAPVDLTRLASWLRAGGTWQEKDRALLGTGGHLLFAEELGDYRFGVTAELVSGPDTVIGFLARAGGPGARDQGYAANILFGARKLNVFRAANGAWFVANPAWPTWTIHEGVDAKRNRVVWQAVGERHTITLNGKLLLDLVDGLTRRGRPGLWVESLATVVRFSDFELERL